MWRFFSGWASLVCVCGLLPANADADTVDLARQYGAGVHDYYRGCYYDAIQHFDLAMGDQSRDARVYFFRGLAKLRLGWTGDARMDFVTGAQLEAALNRGDVGRALERVQGADRMLIERYRREAKLIPRVMLEQMVPQPIEPVVPPVVAPGTKPQVRLPNLPADRSDPFREDAPGMLGRGDLEPAKEPAEAKPPATRSTPSTADDDMDPFAEGPGDDEPFGSGVAPDAEVSDDSQDPFAMDDPAPADEPAAAPDDSDPFGDAADSSAPTQDADPADDSDASSDDDEPFGF